MDTNVNLKLTLLQKLETCAPAGIVGLPEVGQKFKHLYKVMNGGNSELAEVKYEAEKFHFAKLISENKTLQSCSKLSLYGCFIDMAVNGLSFDPAMKHAYVVPMPANIGTKDNPKWEQRATLMIDGRGELIIRVRQGQIKYADNPITVYDGDNFSFGTSRGSVFLEHTATFPRKSDKIIACYLRIERPDSSVDYKVFGIEEIMKLKEFSKQKTALAWTTGLEGMIQIKTLKHAFRSYPKVKIGNFSSLQTVAIEPEVEMSIDYGLNDLTPTPPIATQPPIAIEPTKQPLAEDSFLDSTPVATATITIDDDEF